MKFLVCFLSILILSACFVNVGVVRASGEGQITKTSTTQQQALNSIADWYTLKKIKTTDSGVVATKWSGLMLKGFHNPRQDSSVTVKIKTNNGDTVTISVLPSEWTPRIPPVNKIISLGRDSLIGCFQKW
jgi:hypothetical protein